MVRQVSRNEEGGGVCVARVCHTRLASNRLTSQLYKHGLAKDTLEMKSRHPYYTLGSWPLNINYIPKCCTPKTLRIPNSFSPDTNILEISNPHPTHPVHCCFFPGLYLTP